MITSPHNHEAQGGPPAPAPPRARRFVAEGEDLVAAADAAGWPRRVPPARRRRRRARRCWTRSPRWARARARWASTSERWAAPAGPLCVALWGVRDPGNVGTVAAQRARLRRRLRRRRPGQRRPVRARGGARLDGRDLRRARRARRTRRRAARRARRARRPRAASRCAARLRRRRDARRRRRARRAARDVVAACDRVAHIPIAGESLNAAMAATVALYELARRGPAAMDPRRDR